jgi:Spy/CpxP family protein refolding chaperone
MKKALVIVVAVMIGLVASVALAQEGPPPAVMKKIAHDIGLNDDQIKKIENAGFLADQEKLDLRHEIEKNRLEIRHLMSADKPDEGAIYSLLDKIGALQTKVKKNRVGLMLKIRSMVTKEQWEKLEVLQAERMRGIKDKARRFRGGDEPPQPPPPPAPPGR